MDTSKDLARALRRHHTARLKKVRRGYWGHHRGAPHERAWTPRALGMVVATPHPCSCLGCGNQRRCLGEGTMQERRWQQHSLQELLADAAPLSRAMRR